MLVAFAVFIASVVLNYHVVAAYSDGVTNTTYDAVYNKSGDFNTQYGEWLRYYYTFPPGQIEPPGDLPGLYNHPVGENPLPLWGNFTVRKIYHDDLIHPPYPLLTVGAGSILLNGNLEYSSDGADSFRTVVAPWDRDYMMFLKMFASEKLGNRYLYPAIDIPGESLERSSNKKAPGDYMVETSTLSPIVSLDMADNKWFDNCLKTILTPNYYDRNISGFIKKYDDVLGDSSRHEFYGKYQFNGIKFSTGGWFGKFTDIGVYSNYSSVVEFLKLARQYFQLPEISQDKVDIYNEGDDFFYSVLDRDNMFWLRGYNVVLDNQNDLKDMIKTNIIQLAKYYDKDFVP